MYAYIEGTIIHHGLNYIILKTSAGIGFRIFTLHAIRYTLHDNAKLFVHHYIREDKQDLYGFKSVEELEIFETLISISGVGPKTAFIITSQFSAREIKQAIEKDDISFFQTIKGLGKKTAGKIILELKGKLVSGKNDLSSPENSEVIDALVGLGYQKKDLAPIIPQIPAKCKTTEERVKWILRNKK